MLYIQRLNYVGANLVIDYEKTAKLLKEVWEESC